MKKIINAPSAYVDDMLKGIYAAHPGKVKCAAGDLRCYCAAEKKPGKVAIITGGGPRKSTYVMGMFLYQEGFSYFHMGYASAISWIEFIAIMILTLIIFGTSKYCVHYGDE